MESFVAIAIFRTDLYFIEGMGDFSETKIVPDPASMGDIISAQRHLWIAGRVGSPNHDRQADASLTNRHEVYQEMNGGSPNRSLSIHTVRTIHGAFGLLVILHARDGISLYSVNSRYPPRNFSTIVRP